MTTEERPHAAEATPDRTPQAMHTNDLSDRPVQLGPTTEFGNNHHTIRLHRIQTEDRSRSVDRHLSAADRLTLDAQYVPRRQRATTDSSAVICGTLRSRSVPPRSQSLAEAPPGHAAEPPGATEGSQVQTPTAEGSQPEASQLLDVAPAHKGASSTVNSKIRHESGDSSGSGSTITQASFSHRPKPSRDKPTEYHGEDRRPIAFEFLDPDSPAVTRERIQRTVSESSHWRQRRDLVSGYTYFPAPSNSSLPTPKVFSEAHAASRDRSAGKEEELDTHHGYLVTQDGSPVRTGVTVQTRYSDRQEPDKFGTPEMPRGSTALPHMPDNVLKPPSTMRQHAKHLPRAEKLPVSGYELLAARLSQPSATRSRHDRDVFFTGRGEIDGSNGRDLPRIKPVYRRFEALNHRVLLHLQDELSELEEQLHRLDTADTQTRRLQDRILPASRRAEHLAGGELQWHRTDILGKIGFKLEQYNRVLSSFTNVQALPVPNDGEVEYYRAYLDTEQPISEAETRFLDQPDDLITLDSGYYPQESRSQSSSSEYDFSGDEATPMPKARPAMSGSVLKGSRTSSIRSTSRQSSGTRDMDGSELIDSKAVDAFFSSIEILHLAASVAVAILVPIITFSVIPGLVGRMTVVLLVAVCVLGAQIQAGTIELVRNGQHRSGLKPGIVAAAAAYGAVMAVAAATFS